MTSTTIWEVNTRKFAKISTLFWILTLNSQLWPSTLTRRLTSTTGQSAGTSLKIALQPRTLMALTLLIFHRVSGSATDSWLGVQSIQRTRFMTTSALRLTPVENHQVSFAIGKPTSLSIQKELSLRLAHTSSRQTDMRRTTSAPWSQLRSKDLTNSTPNARASFTPLLTSKCLVTDGTPPGIPLNKRWAGITGRLKKDTCQCTSRLMKTTSATLSSTWTKSSSKMASNSSSRLTIRASHSRWELQSETETTTSLSTSLRSGHRLLLATETCHLAPIHSSPSLVRLPISQWHSILMQLIKNGTHMPASG